MKVSGFSFVRNAIKYDYPIVESVQSILPICNDFVLAVGKSEDETLPLVQSINKEKVHILETVWDDNMRQGGQVLALETNKAFQAIPNDSDWAFYIQGDEIVHEKYLDPIYNAMLRWKDDLRVDGLLFKYVHFYGSYDYVGTSERWYPHEIRVIRNNKSFYSYRDAQGFKKGKNEKLWVKPANAHIYHYGWVKTPKTQQDKQINFKKYWHNDEFINTKIAIKNEFDYSIIDSLSVFNDTHPAVMLKRIKEINWKFDYDLSWNKRTLKDRVKKLIEKYLGIYLGYKNYKKI